MVCMQACGNNKKKTLKSTNEKKVFLILLLILFVSSCEKTYKNGKKVIFIIENVQVVRF